MTRRNFNYSEDDFPETPIVEGYDEVDDPLPRWVTIAFMVVFFSIVSLVVVVGVVAVVTGMKK